MSNLQDWAENDLSHQLLKSEEETRRKTPLVSLLMAIIIFVVLSGGFLTIPKYRELIVIGIPLAATLGMIGALLYYTATVSRMKNYPKKIKYTEIGIYYLTRNNKEKFIPWSSITYIEPYPDRKFPDYCVYWKKGFEVTTVGPNIGVELKNAWEEHKIKKGKNSREKIRGDV